MAWFSNKSGGRDLPDYFLKDQVGGLSHLLRHSRLTSIEVYARELLRFYAKDTVDLIIMGQMILLQKDKDKYKQMDELFERYELFGGERTNHEDQCLLSFMIWHAMMPWQDHPHTLELLVSGDATCNRIRQYVSRIYLPAQAMGKLYAEMIG